MRKTKQEKQIDKEIEVAYGVHGNCVQIPIMKITEIYKAGHDAAKAGISIDQAVMDAINKFRVN